MRARAVAGSHRRRAARRHRPQSAPLPEIRNCSVESFIVEKCTTTKGSTAHACTRIQLRTSPLSLRLTLSLSLSLLTRSHDSHLPSHDSSTIGVALGANGKRAASAKVCSPLARRAPVDPPATAMLPCGACCCVFVGICAGVEACGITCGICMVCTGGIICAGAGAANDTSGSGRAAVGGGAGGS